MGEASINLPAELSAGEIVDCTVEQIMPYGAFVRMTKTGRKGMIHISELSYSFVKNITDVLNIGDNIQAKIIRIDERGRVDLSLKQTQEPPQRQPRPGRMDKRPFVPRDSNREGRPPRDRSIADRLDTSGRPATTPEEADSFEKKMASFLKTSEAKITDLNTRNTARAGRPSRRRQNSRDY